MIDERADSDWANLKAVAPFTGAWIEIIVIANVAIAITAVAPFTGAWIEIRIIVSTYQAVSGRTLHGCVD